MNKNIDRYRGSRLDRVVTRLTKGRLGVETQIVHGRFLIDDATGERLYPSRGTKVRKRLVRGSPLQGQS